MRRLGWGTAVGAVVVGLTVLFLGRMIGGQWAQLRAYDWSVDPVRLIASILFLGVVFVWGVWTWQLILRRLGVGVTFGPLVRIWFLSSLARYVPGKVWQFVGAAELGRRSAIPPIPLVTSMMIQMAFLMASAAVVALPFLLASAALDVSPALLAGATALTLLLAVAGVHPAVLNGALRLVPRALHREVMRWTGSWPGGLLLLGFFVVSWIGNGLAFTLFVSAIVDVPAGAVPALVAINAISVAVGVLVVVVPAGLGAREAVLAVLLEPYAGLAAAAALLAVLSRLWIVATEVLGALVTGGWGLLRPAAGRGAGSIDGGLERPPSRPEPGRDRGGD